MDTMTVAQELLRLEEADLQQAWQDKLDRAQGCVCCPECGSADGMVALSAEVVIAYLDEPHTYPWPEQGMYRYTGEEDRLFTPCALCNGKGAPAVYTPVSELQVRAWAEQRRPAVGRLS